MSETPQGLSLTTDPLEDAILAALVRDGFNGINHLTLTAILNHEQEFSCRSPEVVTALESLRSQGLVYLHDKPRVWSLDLHRLVQRPSTKRANLTH